MSLFALTIPTAEVFAPLLHPSRYKGAYGGRGSAKSHFFADLAVETALCVSGLRLVGIREVQKTLKDSAMRLIADKIAARGLTDQFRILNDRIMTPGNGVMIFVGMKDHTAQNIKSLEGFDRAWVEEAQTLSAKSLEMLRPTIRKPGSELWFSWNPRSPKDAVDAFLRGSGRPENAIVIESNYRDNPWFPKELEAERKLDRQTNPHRYGHIWLGHYEPAVIGAIWDRARLEELRVAEPPVAMTRILVAIDPAVSAEPGSDAHGIIVVGLGEDGHGYVLEDCSCKGAPRIWAERAIATYDKWDADAIVAEINQGGDMVRHTLQSVRRSLRIIEVRAARGKHVRAEPIAALYALGQIHHVGSFPDLEDQMCAMTAAGYEGRDSPDRCDALVWGMSELFPRLIARQTGGLYAMVAHAGFNPYD